MGLMHNLFRKIDENVYRRRNKRSAPRSEPLSNIESLEQRIALTANVYSVNNSGDSAGYLTIMLDESGDDLYLRQAIDSASDGSPTVPVLQYAGNSDFSAANQRLFSTNDLLVGLDSFQDVFVSQGVANTFDSTPVPGLSPAITLPNASQFDGVARTLPANLVADETFAVLPGTLGGNADFGGSFLIISNNAGQNEFVSFATLDLLDEQDGTLGGDIDLVFTQTAGNSGTTSISLDFGAAEDVTLSGEINLASGRIVLDLDPAGNPPAETYDTTFFVRYGSPVVAADPSTVVLASGFTLDAGFIVDLPSVDSTVSINSPINSPTGADGLIDLRATNVLVNAPVTADDGFRVLESRFHNPPSVTASLTDDAVTSQTVTITTPAVAVELGASVSAQNPNARLVEIIPSDTNVIAVNNLGATTELTLSNSVSLAAGRTLNFYNPISSQQYEVDISELTESSTLFLELQAPDALYDIQPGAVVLNLDTPTSASALVPPNTFVAAVNTVTGRVDLTRAISLPVGVTNLDFYNPGYDGTSVENFAATAPIQSDDFLFKIEDDISSNVRDRGRLYLAGSSGLAGFGGGNAPRLSVTTSVSDIIFESQVSAVDQSYFFETSVSETPYSFTTKNSSGVPTGSINATTMAVQLSNLSERNPADSVVQVVDLDTAVDSLRISAGFDEQLNPPYVEDDPAGPFPFAITVREANALSLDAALSSAGPVNFTVGGNLALTASIQSQSDLSFTSSGTMTGTAWLTTANGSIDVTATDVNISGLTQVLTAPFDGFSTDVSITASNGSVSLGQGVRAVNKIVIDQQSTTGSVQSDGLLSGYDVQVFSEGDVDIDTSASFVDVSVASTVNGAANTARTVTVDSDRDSQFRISTAGGTANISALGVDNDNGTPGVVTDDIAALSLELRETGVLSATAPQGSIDVIAVTSDELVMGVAADLLQGNAANMQAAGSVEIRTTQSPVTVLDAAVAGQGELQVRAAATANLAGTYSQNTPGITPSTITAAANGSINGAALTASFGGLDAGTNPLRFRDLVLLSNQTVRQQNGVYQVISLGNQSTPWQLRRYGLAETTSELPVGTRVYVTDGDERGDTFRVNAYDNKIDTTPLRVTPGTARSATEIAVRFATDTVLDGIFNGAGTISGASLGAGVPLRINETPVEDGDLILVQFGAELNGAGNNTEPSSTANGVYEVDTSIDAWVLTRYNNPEPPVVPPAVPPVVEEATVVVMEGFYRTSRFGGTFDVAYDGLGLVDLTIADDSTNIASAIGSYDPRDTTTLVVSTAGATNDAAGSLGKMLTLAQANEAEDLVGQNILQELTFGNVLGSVTGNTGTIVLQQELPVIEKPIVIDASQRYTLDASTTSQVLVIDGSRITTSSESTFVTRGDEVNGLVLGEFASADVTDPFRPLPSTVSSLRFGGFEQGAAVLVNGASNVLLNNLTIGQNSNDASQAVRYGIRVTGDSGLDGPVSIVGGSITSANIPTNRALDASPTSPDPVTNFLDGAGVLLDDLAQNVQIVGTNIGSTSAANLVGVLARGDNDAASGGVSSFNSVGASEIGSFVAPTVLNLFTLTIPATDVLGNAIDIDDVFIGQSVSASEFAAGTTILSINKSTRQVTLNQAAILTNTAASVTLGTPSRTAVESNFWGLMLESGATRVVNSDVASNIYDGIFIGTLDGLSDPFTIVIGSSTTVGSDSNAIFSNGRNGIRFAENIVSSVGATDITIQGNYIGSAVGTAFVGNTQGSYFWEGGETINPLDTAFASLGYDSTTDTPPAPGYITGDPLFRVLIKPEISGGDVDKNGNENADFVDGGSTIAPPPPGPPAPNDDNWWPNDA